MKWIESLDIKNWSKRYDAKSTLPRIVGRLIRATTPADTFLEFPGGSDVFVGGWDGQVNCGKATAYVPEGISLWELGTETKNQTKAEGDYQKRTANPLGYNPADCTFIFVTPNYWRDKEKWRQKKLEDGIWRDIKVYDSRNLEEWINQATAIARDFAILINKYPSDGIQTTEDFWKEWSVGPKGQLSPSIVTNGRENEIEKLKSFLNNPSPGIKAVQAPSKEEAIAFIVACAHQFEINHRENFFSRSLIIDTVGNFRSISNNLNALCLISRFEETTILYRGVSDGHHVLVPMGADDIFNSEDIILLPRVDKEGAINSLKDCGLNNEEAERLVKESGRNLTILKRLLKFPQNKVEWAQPENAKELIPALLLGRWDENREGDKEVLSAIAGEDYDTYIAKLERWKVSEVPFIYQIGTTWRLASPLDAWANLSSRITKRDLKKLESNFLKVLSTIRPAFDLEPEKRYMASFYGKEPVYTEWTREGLTQSLILIGVYGIGLELPVNTTPQLWVDSIIGNLLSNATDKLWASLNHVMPLLAEASPDTFLDMTLASLSKEKPEIMGMFEEEPSILTPNSHHTGLLWALEKLAWIPEYLGKVTTVLGKLAAIDPGGKLSNRPISSLRQVFLPWMPQTFGDLDKRQEALGLLVKSEPDIAWQLLLQLLPQPHDISHPTAKTRWRNFSQSTPKESLTYEEIFTEYTLIVEKLLSLTGVDEERIAELIDKSDHLLKHDRDKILSYIKENLGSVVQSSYAIWHQVRKLLNHHRSHPNTNWALPESELENFQFLYEHLRPNDTIEKIRWMFDENWPELANGFNHEETEYEQQQVIIDAKRLEGLQEIFAEYGINKIEELSRQVKEKWTFGQTAALLIDSKDHTLLFLSEEILLEEEQRYSAMGFIQKKNELNSINWTKLLFEDLQQRGYSVRALATFLIPLPQSQSLWDSIAKEGVELEVEYWTMVQPFLYKLTLHEKIFAIRKLLRVNRALTAIHESYRIVSELDTSLLFELLEAGVTSKEKTRFPKHEIEVIFENFYNRADIDKSKIALLEWQYLTVLTSWHGTKHSLILYDELAKNPSFFVEILSLIYKPQNDQTDANKLDEDEAKKKVLIAQQAYRLLSAWKKVPGTDENGGINGETLFQWVTQVRESAKQADRIKFADVEIGKILAQFPEDSSGQWPPDTICQVIDTINSEVLTRNFETAIFNKRGFSSRGPYEGGNRERDLSAYFLKFYNRISAKWPITAAVLKHLSKKYEADAKRQDESAEIDSLEL